MCVCNFIMINPQYGLGYLCKEYGICRHSILLHKILVIVSIYLHSMSTLALEKTDYNYGVCIEELIAGQSKSLVHLSQTMSKPSSKILEKRIHSNMWYDTTQKMMNLLHSLGRLGEFVLLWLSLRLAAGEGLIATLLKL